MAAKINKLRGKLDSYAKEREQFENKRKELEEEMSKGRKNMTMIQKGLRNNEIKIDSALVVDVTQSDGFDITYGLDGSTSTKKPPSRMVKRLPSKTTNAIIEAPSGSPSPSRTIALTIPSTPMLSEWAFTGPTDSTPPIFKNQDLYEYVRLLGRGSFGTVDLVKNVEDNKL
eukprot:gene8864-18362_t